MLARRVASELQRWQITIDDSAGRPLAHTAAGTFLCLLAEAAGAGFAPVPLLALLKHPFARLDQEPADFRRQARALDRLALRGPSPDLGLDGIAKAIARARAEARDRKPQHACDALANWWRKVAMVLRPLEGAFAQKSFPLDELIAIHLAAAEHLSCDELDCPIWRDADGEAASLFFDQFRTGAAGLPDFAPDSYPALLHSLAMKIPVRPRYNRHRAIAILGPLEARLQSFDLVILGGLNEGVWPQGAPADPWFSRPCARHWAWSSRNDALAFRPTISPAWRRAARASHARGESGRRADRRFALAAAHDAIDQRAGADEA